MLSSQSMKLAPVDYFILSLYFAIRAGHRMAGAPAGLHQRGFSDLRPLSPSLDHQPGIHRREPGRAGSDRHVRVGREIRHHDRAFLLDRRGSGDAVRRRVHDAVLLRQPRPQRAGIFETALRRKDAHAERRHLRGDDDFFFRNLDVRSRPPVRAGAGLELYRLRAALGIHRPDLHVSGRTHQRHLQRGSAILSDRARLRAAFHPGACTKPAAGAALHRGFRP